DLSKNWWLPMMLIFIISLAGVTFIGFETYDKAPPIPDFVSENGQTVISQQDILNGQELFHRYALMEYGRFFGDGALRGPDFTAQALHETAVAMEAFYHEKISRQRLSANDQEIYLKGIRDQVQQEIKHNRYDEDQNTVTLSAAQKSGISAVENFYLCMFTDPDFT